MMKKPLTIHWLKVIAVVLIFSMNLPAVFAEGERKQPYIQKQREKAINLLPTLFKDSGGGTFSDGKDYRFILQNPCLNLWEEIRPNAIEYFRINNVPWWEGTTEIPTGHLLSSQIACVNHLFYLRDKKELATKVLQNIDNRIVNAVEMPYPDADAGYVAFELVGKENYLGERQHTRGEFATSVDAVMIGKKEDGKNILVLIEWKYTEFYEARESCYIPARYKIYNPLLGDTESPIKKIAYKNKPFEPLYYEPFYELMRQTLLGWKMAKAQEYNCDEYIHLYIVPDENAELLLRNTSPGLKGATIYEAWQNILVNPNLFKIISPEKLLEPLRNEPNTKSYFEYLTTRY